MTQPKNSCIFLDPGRLNATTLRHDPKMSIEYMCSAMHHADADSMKFILVSYYQMLLLTLTYVLFIFYLYITYIYWLIVILLLPQPSLVFDCNYANLKHGCYHGFFKVGSQDRNLGVQRHIPFCKKVSNNNSIGFFSIITNWKTKLITSTHYCKGCYAIH